MKPRITRGPWATYQLSKDSDPKERLIVTTEDERKEICGIINNPADADLIAAAPNLLKACKRLIAAYKAGEENEHVEWNDVDDAHEMPVNAVRNAQPA